MIVLHASVLANALGDDGRDGEVALQAMEAAHNLSAPDLIDVETAAVLRKRWLAGYLSERRFSEAIDDLLDLQLERYPALPLLHRAYELRENLTVYDAVYVALAEMLGCPVVTADARLCRVTGLRCAIEVVTSD